MADKYQSAELLLKLYELRREETMRKAREWFISFNPGSAQDMIAAIGGKHGAYFRMVVSYWDMAASFVSNAVIDEEMFNDATGEHLAVFCKVQPYLAEFRSIIGEPNYLKHLEKLVMRMPNVEERLARFRKRLKAIAAANRAAAEDEVKQN